MAETPPAAAVNQRAQVLQLVNLRAAKMENALRERLGARLRPIENADADHPGWIFVHAPGWRVELLFDHTQSIVTVRGADVLVDQLARMILALDRGAVVGERAMCVVTLHRADPAQVMLVIQAYRSTRRNGGTAPANATASPLNRTSAVHPASYATPLRPVVPGARVVQPVVYRGQSPDAAAAPTTQTPAAAPAGATAAPSKEDAAAGAADDSQRLRARLRGLDSDLEVETLPDLDAIILRGKPHDVKELRRIIEEIERLSKETQPEIEIVYLKNAACEALANVIKQVEREFTGGRQGRVTTLALENPNALLLVGWGEALKSVKGLIGKLDVPIPPDTQFRVFNLQYAVALEAQTTIQGFFSSRAGLGAQAKVTADVRTNSLIVQAAPRDLEEVAGLVQKLDQPQGKAVQEMRVFKLRNALAADVANVLQEALAGPRRTTGQKNAALELLAIDAQGQKLLKAGVLNDVRITPDARANSILVAGPAESMDLLGALIEQLDSPAAVAQIKVFRIINGDATSLAQMLRVLLPSSISPGAAGSTLGSGGEETSLVPVRFSVDLRTNSIIATGSQGELSIIEALLLRLDEDTGAQRKNTVYRLKNSPAADAAAAINEFLRSERQVQQITPGVINPFQQIESEVIVVPERVSNSLIVSATPRYFDDIMELVEKLDAEPPQVMIQVMIAQVRLDNTEEFGIEMGLQDSVLFNRSTLSNLVTTSTTLSNGTTTSSVISADLTPGYNFNNGTPLGNSGSATNASQVGGQSLSNFGVGRVNSDLGYGGLVLSASSESVSLLVRALSESKRLDVLSRPQVMTLDNQPAFIQVGQRVPRITGSSLTSVGQQNNIVLENVGLILGVTPRISPDGRVIMEVDAEKSALGNIEDGIPVTTSGSTVIKSPTIELTTAQTTVSAIDGETIVLGGLITNSKEVIHRRVPYLSDVPILGFLFRYDATNKERTEMLIILTPHIIRNTEDLERLRNTEESRIHWCIGDVNEINGPVGYNAERNVRHTPTIYPDSNPRGTFETPTPPEPETLPAPTAEALPPGATVPATQ